MGKLTFLALVLALVAVCNPAVAGAADETFQHREILVAAALGAIGVVPDHDIGMIDLSHRGDIARLDRGEEAVGHRPDTIGCGHIIPVVRHGASI